jgi:S-formylglutathione hydrolase FrmB
VHVLRHRIGELSLLTGWVPLLMVAVGVLAWVWLVGTRDPSFLTRSLPRAAAAAAGAALVAVVVVDRVWRPFPDPLPAPVVAWTASAVLAVFLAGPRLRRSHGLLGWAVTVIAVPTVVLVAVFGVNTAFAAFPTVAAALGRPPGQSIDFTKVPGPTEVVSGRPLSATWRAPLSTPAAGRVSTVAIPGTTSGFQGRDAQVYLPPAYLGTPRARLPVLVLLSGQPGSPSDWVLYDGLAGVMDAYAAQHDGLAPVVVIPDGTGSLLANPLCLDSALGQLDTYLSVDVPAWISSHLQVSTDHADWAVGGQSYGGTCSLQLAVNHPDLYPTFLDLSGQSEPTLGTRDATVAAAFGGDESRFTAVNPLDVIARNPPAVHGVLTAGANDDVYGPQARAVVAASQAAGMDVSYVEVLGGHDFAAWRAGLVASLDWLAGRLGLTPEQPAPTTTGPP